VKLVSVSFETFRTHYFGLLDVKVVSLLVEHILDVCIEVYNKC